jgi:bifunctional non-homologous end joining protein LigD
VPNAPVEEVQFVGWSGSGRVRHAVFLGLRADKPLREVIRAIADPDAPRWTPKARPEG